MKRDDEVIYIPGDDENWKHTVFFQKKDIDPTLGHVELVIKTHFKKVICYFRFNRKWPWRFSNGNLYI